MEIQEDGRTVKCRGCSILLCDECYAEGINGICEECEEGWWDEQYGDNEYGLETDMEW